MDLGISIKKGDRFNVWITGVELPELNDMLARMRNEGPHNLSNLAATVLINRIMLRWFQGLGASGETLADMYKGNKSGGNALELRKRGIATRGSDGGYYYTPKAFITSGRTYGGTDITDVKTKGSSSSASITNPMSGNMDSIILEAIYHSNDEDTQLMTDIVRDYIVTGKVENRMADPGYRRSLISSIMSMRGTKTVTYPKGRPKKAPASEMPF